MKIGIFAEIRDVRRKSKYSWKFVLFFMKIETFIEIQDAPQNPRFLPKAQNFLQKIQDLPIQGRPSKGRQSLKTNFTNLSHGDRC